MKKIAFLFTLLVLTVSCSDDDDNKTTPPQSIVGTWKLIEVYSDPGDGSGDFTAVESDRTITFNADGTLTSNGNLCYMTIDTDVSTSATYSENALLLNCGFEEESLEYTYEINESHLIINYPCIEACQAKYSKINN